MRKKWQFSCNFWDKNGNFLAKILIGHSIGNFPEGQVIIAPNGINVWYFKITFQYILALKLENNVRGLSHMVLLWPNLSPKLTALEEGSTYWNPKSPHPHSWNKSMLSSSYWLFRVSVATVFKVNGPIISRLLSSVFSDKGSAATSEQDTHSCYHFWWMQLTMKLQHAVTGYLCTRCPQCGYILHTSRVLDIVATYKSCSWN